MKNMDKNVIEYIKILGIDQINAASSGHPGIVLGAAPIIYSIYANHLRVDEKFQSANRDKFVLSAGHGSALLYSTLYMVGLLEIDDLKQFRKANSRTPGHPEYRETPGVEVTTGPLGQGLATAVGMALAQKLRNFDSKVYVLCGDGDLMEGISYESTSLAGHLNLNNLIILYDSNDITLDNKLSASYSEDTISRFKAIGFETYKVDSKNLEKLNATIEKAKKSKKPVFIEVKSVIGDGTSVAGTSVAHGKPLSSEDVLKLHNDFGYSEAFPEILELRNYMTNKFKSRFIEKLEINDIVPRFNSFKEVVGDLRTINGELLKHISSIYPLLIGGSADLGSSTKTNVGTLISKDDYTLKDIFYGVREHAMGAITNGLALSGYHAYSSTFLTFSDYMRPSIRLAAIMDIPSVFIFTHDSISIGPDGPTHQPIEHIDSLRSIPNLRVLRPADLNEVIGSWNYILNNNHPCALIVSRDKVDNIKTTDIAKVELGAYIVRDGDEGVIISTGSELSQAILIADSIYEERGINIRVVSMPSMELFLEQSIIYRDKILPPELNRVVIEAGVSGNWNKFVYSEKYLITLSRFGLSGTKEEVLKEMNFDFDTLKKRVNELF